MSEQNYSNHTVFPKSLVYTAAGALAGGVFILAGLFYPNSTMGHCLVGTGALINSLSTIFTLWVCRTYAVTLQDRIIRTEMRIRLREVLPEALRGRANELSKKQLIGLRFASDGEMADLVQKVLDEKIQKGDDIKRLVKHWQADHDRV